ncbi:polymorphic toxin type 23 domain-containing protein [Dysgonomonas sp. 511]|uniref:polymorphic toxin type 23 domain-containing protein n=1 Tax=Dysgonomonas sp. 511 TaxID=2302930 RepID=UPI0013D602BA|nr:polymorphic toxin type 23 domain-containing protein [Dysgonomonas sp. 511]NDV79611.1 hypothetical protein [Dysgonomonas sp. 511]
MWRIAGKYKSNQYYFSFIKRVTILIVAFFCTNTLLHSQYRFDHDNDYPATLTYGPEKHNGFRVSMSLVAMFTAGAKDRNGLRIGAGITLSQTIDNWTLSSGFDTYKATRNFGLGTTFAGITFDDGKYSGSYYVNKYHQGDKQVSGIIRVGFRDFSIGFEDDILALPFTGFKIYDRYRTAALELRYKGFVIGSNVYTTDINGVTDISAGNSKGAYRDGRQISSPVYVGYTTNNVILRYGWNSQLGGLVGQNGWHRKFFSTPDFKAGDYSNQFVQIGIDKPYTLY